MAPQRILLVLAAAILAAATGIPALRAQTRPGLGTVSNFKMPLAYHDGVSQTKTKSVLTGATAQPRPDGIYFITGLRIETHRLSGETDMVVTAPECTFDQRNRVASSPGRFKVETTDGRFSIQGQGFEWRQGDARLVISNKVETLLRLDMLKTTEKKP